MLYCVPFNYHWNKSIPGGHCYEFQVVYVIGLVLNLVTDIAILAAPVPIIWGLQMSPKSKKAVTGMFLLGGLYVVSLASKFLENRTCCCGLTSVD